MVNRYRNVELPSWVKDADKEKLIEHIQYLTSNNNTLTKQLGTARSRYRKAENLLKKNNIPFKNKK